MHTARLKDGREVVVKVLRPGMREIIERDLELLHTLAGLAERYWPEAAACARWRWSTNTRRPSSTSSTCMREAANAAQLRRNFAGMRDLLYVPEVYWDWCRVDVMVMERIHGMPVSDMAGAARGAA